MLDFFISGSLYFFIICYYSRSMNKKVVHKFSDDKSLIKAHTVIVAIEWVFLVIVPSHPIRGLYTLIEVIDMIDGFYDLYCEMFKKNERLTGEIKHLKILNLSLEKRIKHMQDNHDKIIEDKVS